MNIVAKCTPPCAPANTYVLPGSVLFAGINSSGTDANLIVDGGVTSVTSGLWTELMPADMARVGAAIQNKDSAGSLYVLQFDTGLPASGTADGEIEIPIRPAYYKFDWTPNARYVVRGDAASIDYSLVTW